MADIGPAIQMAVGFITNKLDQGELRLGQRLPATRILAKTIGISQRTMIKAVAELKQRRLISGVKGGCLRAGSSQSEIPIDNLESKKFWQLKRIEIEKDILSGVYSQTGTLPSLKEMQSRYGASFRTMRKIMHTMAVDSIVRICGKSYVIPGAPLHAKTNRIVFITHAFPFLTRSGLNPEEFRLIDRLEYECIRRDLRLEVIELDFGDSRNIVRVMADPVIRNQSLGFVLDAWWTMQVQPQYENLLHKLLKLKKPVAIVDEWDGYSLPQVHCTNPMAQVYRIQGKGAGARIARLLLNLRHQSIAFISLAPNFSWSQNRLVGIREQFSSVGLGQNVHTFFDTEITEYLFHMMVLSGYSEKLIKKILTLGHPADQANERYQHYLNLKMKIKPESFDSREIKKLQEILAPLADALHGTSKARSLESVYSMVINEADACMSAMLLAPLFKKAIACRDITAWVCASDITAFDALKFLDTKKVRVPGQISLAGFDNVPVQTASRRLTSFDFNARGFAYQMLDFITRPPKPRGNYRHSVAEVEGMVIERGSTGKRSEG